MLDFVIFAVTFAVALIVAIIYLYPSSKRTTTIPGLDPSSKQDGNLADIIRAGSLHEFLLSLHQQYGSITSFWMGDTQIVSLASPQLVEANKKAFDRSSELYVLFEPLLGSQNLLYASGDEGRQRRSNFVNAFKDDTVAEHCTKLGEIGSELMKKWSKMSEQHIPVEEHMMALAVRFQLIKILGDYFENNADILKLRRNLDTCWNEFEKLLQDLAEPGNHRREAFSDAQAAIETILAKAVENHRADGDKKTHLLIDTLLASKATDEQIITDCFLTILFEFHTLGALLTWSLYFLATHADIQTKLAKEIKTLPKGEPTVDDLKKLKFLKQVLNETHRCAVLNQWSATSQSFDTEIGGHKIPKNTPIINAVGVLMQDEKYCSLPTQYDPDRFSDDALKSSSSSSDPVAFQPFAFADKRTRLANERTQLYASAFLVNVLREFRLSLVKGQVVTPVYGLVTHPDDEIWITATKRDKS